MDTNKSGGWLSGTKKLFSNISTEVSQIFSADSQSKSYPTNEEIERRVGHSGTPAKNDLLAQFDAQLNKELNGPSSASSPQYRRPITDTPTHLRYSHSHPTSFSQLSTYPASSSPSPSHNSTTMKTSWNPHEASDMGLMPSLPTYQQQILQATGHEQNNDVKNQHPYYNSNGTILGSQPTINNTGNYPPPITNNSSMNYPPYQSSNVTDPNITTPYITPPHPTPLPRSGDSQSIPLSNYSTVDNSSGLPYINSMPIPPTTGPPYYGNNSNNQLSNTNIYSSPGPSSSTTYQQSAGQTMTYTSTSSLSSPFTQQIPATGLPYPSQPISPRSQVSYPPSSSNPSIPTPSFSTSYVGPSFTSSAYSSGTSGSPPPPPPPSSYWMQRAAQQQQSGTSNNRADDGNNTGTRVDYSDLDPKSMDFAYAWKDKEQSS